MGSMTTVTEMLGVIVTEEHQDLGHEDGGMPWMLGRGWGIGRG